MKIVVIGSLNMDFVVNVDHMPAVGETILSDNFALIPGGKGANQAFGLGRMGADVVMLGAVGRDGQGDAELDSLRNAGVDVSHVARLEDASTGMAFISVNAQGNNSIIVVQGANQRVDRAYIDSKMEVLRAADVVVLQLEIPLDTVHYAAAKAKEMGKTVILDPAPAPRHLPDDLLGQVDILKPNELELAAITGMEDAKDRVEEACRALLDRGVGCVLASLGPEGVYMAPADGQAMRFPCEDVPVVDTTAAGDSFTAGVAYALANGRDLAGAVDFANQIANIVVTRKGAQSSMPTREEVERLWSGAR